LIILQFKKGAKLVTIDKGQLAKSGVNLEVFVSQNLYEHHLQTELATVWASNYLIWSIYLLIKKCSAYNFLQFHTIKSKLIYQHEFHSITL